MSGRRRLSLAVLLLTYRTGLVYVRNVGGNPTPRVQAGASRGLRMHLTYRLG